LAKLHLPNPWLCGCIYPIPKSGYQLGCGIEALKSICHSPSTSFLASAESIASGIFGSVHLHPRTAGRMKHGPCTGLFTLSPCRGFCYAQARNSTELLYPKKVTELFGYLGIKSVAKLNLSTLRLCAAAVQN